MERTIKVLWENHDRGGKERNGSNLVECSQNITEILMLNIKVDQGSLDICCLNQIAIPAKFEYVVNMRRNHFEFPD